ncbi:MAG TPA: hypothetical protein VFW73_01430, partial [Lacipirellulaceae bacterium]|nr:hypothetical protein [Lacipirellulaceae bacterium]
DVFEWMLTMLSSSTELDVVRARSLESTEANGHEAFDKDRQWAEQLGRTVKVLGDTPQSGQEIVQTSREGSYDAIVLPAPSSAWAPSATIAEENWMQYVVTHASCSVFIAVHPTIPREVVG